MSLVTFVLLVAFTLVYAGNAIPNKPAFVDKITAAVNANIDKIALYGAAFALVAALLTLIAHSGLGMFVRFLSNLLIVAMALPWASAQLLPKFQDKIGAGNAEKVNKVVALIKSQEKYIGFAGAGLSVLMFLIVLGS